MSAPDMHTAIEEGHIPVVHKCGGTSYTVTLSPDESTFMLWCVQCSQLGFKVLHVSEAQVN